MLKKQWVCLLLSRNFYQLKVQLTQIQLLPLLLHLRHQDTIMAENKVTGRSGEHKSSRFRQLNSASQHHFICFKTIHKPSFYLNQFVTQHDRFCQIG
jgi:hypothetical protein